jgi:SMC interacting uncharacterized protein involved in chromosome segregation
MSETFEECMERLFKSLASGKSYKSLSRLDLFKVLFDEQQKKIDELQLKNDTQAKMLRGQEATNEKLAKATKENEQLGTELDRISEWLFDSSDREASFDEWSLRYEEDECEEIIKRGEG